ncbi:MAG: CoB--CoM heterodisulfide reductase iron-sulfur subunit B family protein [Deltaproteobacteria bacterium]|nr:CoB--CoM heterodisulfide reductase iron-sulfur subunit B family protein [Deltaproteobacteria bacterium]
MKYIYFPGCSLKSTGKPYEESLLSIFKALDTPLEELNDWNCCGATAYMAVDELKCFALSARNMALAVNQAGGAKDGPVNIIAPCSACYSLLLKSQHYIEENPEVGRIVKTAMKEAGLESKNLHKNVVIRHPLDVLVNDIGLARIKEKVKNSMKGLKVACYYGCLLVRPYATFDSPYAPTTMDRLAEALGAEPVDWPLKTKCCGGTLSGTVQGVGVRLGYLILKEAQKRKADLVLTACPLCQFDLECFQEEMRTHQDRDMHMPVAFFTQLVGRAFNLGDKEVGIQRLFMPLPQQAAAR